MLPKIASFLFLLEGTAQILSKEGFYFSFNIALSRNQKLHFERIVVSWHKMTYFWTQICINDPDPLLLNYNLAELDVSVFRYHSSVFLTSLITYL